MISIFEMLFKSIPDSLKLFQKTYFWDKMIFKMSNVIETFRTPADLLKTLAHPARLAILSILRDGEQCVCHIEAMLELRQAYISQHLKVLKDAGIATDRRDGWNIYYRVIRPEILKVMDEMFSMTGQPGIIPYTHAKGDCPCPKCHPDENLVSTVQVIPTSE